MHVQFADGVDRFMDKLGTKYVPANAGKWELTPADFKEFPERDVVNYPHPDRREFPKPVRLGWMPDTWYRFFYEKTGESGEQL